MGARTATTTGAIQAAGAITGVFAGLAGVHAFAAIRAHLTAVTIVAAAAGFKTDTLSAVAALETGAVVVRATFARALTGAVDALLITLTALITFATMGVVAARIDAIAVASDFVDTAIGSARFFQAELTAAIAIFLAIHPLLAGRAIGSTTVDVGLIAADRAIIAARIRAILRVLSRLCRVRSRILEDIGALTFWQADVVR